MNQRKLPFDFMNFMWFKGASYKAQWNATKGLPRKTKKRFRDIICFCIESDGNSLNKKMIKYFNK